MVFSSFSKEKFPLEKAIALGNSLEAADVEIFFRGRSQDEITFNLLKTAYPHDPAACLSFMQPEAYAFFLPAFLRISLDDYETSDAIPDSVIYDLLAMAQGSNKAKLDAVLSAYTADQLSSVAEFLREMSEKYWHLYPSDDAKKAYLLYWNKFSRKSKLR